MASSINNNIPRNNSDTSIAAQNVTYAEAVRKQNSDAPNNSDDINYNPTMADIAEISVDETTLSDSLEDNSRISLRSDSLENHISECSEVAEVSALCEESTEVSRLYDGSTEVSSNFEDQKLSDSLMNSTDDTKTSLVVEENSSGSCSTSEDEEESSEEALNAADIYSSAIKWQLRNANPKLPETVTVLEAPGGSKVYLVGTAHFSFQSQEDVALTIRETHPDVVMVELCKSRINILSLDEATVLEEVKNMNLEKIRIAIQQNGFMQGALYLLLLNMSAHLTKQLGMAPGGEFRKAFTEAKKIPGCTVHLGDRPIQITLQRALATLSFWKKIKMAWHLLTSKEPISKEEIERCKQRDLLEQTLAEMTGEFPELSKVFVEERDVYLTYSLQVASAMMSSQISPNRIQPSVVVGVVGMGHVPGIVAKWGTIAEHDIPPILSIPKQSRTAKLVRKAVKYTVYGMMMYGCYRLIPKSAIEVPVKALSNLISQK